MLRRVSPIVSLGATPARTQPSGNTARPFLLDEARFRRGYRPGARVLNALFRCRWRHDSLLYGAYSATAHHCTVRFFSSDSTTAPAAASVRPAGTGELRGSTRLAVFGKIRHCDLVPLLLDWMILSTIL